MVWQLKRERLIHLIIDDEDTRTQIMQLLRILQTKVKTFSNTEAFFTVPISHAPACLITEIQLHDHDVITFIKELRNHGLSTPVVVIADQANELNIAVKIIQAGAADYIEKPIIERDFIERVEKILSENL